MFIQVIEGNISDRQALRAALDEWTQRLAGEAHGWRGTTAGVAEDGRSIGVVRFESEQAARRNSERHEQHLWWMETAKLYSGPVTFHDCREVITSRRGGSDDAGFVQVLRGRITDEARVRSLMPKLDELLGQRRPEVIGGTIALHGDGGFTETIYFTSEEEARKGERQEMPAELQELWNVMTDVTFIDLKEPWLYSPR